MHCAAPAERPHIAKQRRQGVQGSSLTPWVTPMSKPRLPWFMIDKDTLIDPRLLMAARELAKRYTLSVIDDDGEVGEEVDVSRVLSCMTSACRGALVTLWGYAHDNIRPDDTLPLDPIAVDALVGLEGFCECMPPEWLQVTDDGRGVYLPNFIEKNQLVKRLQKREADTKRHQVWRDKQRHAVVTHDTRMTGTGPRHDQRGNIENKIKEREAIASPKKATRLPEHWTPTPELISFAETKGLSRADIAEQAERFVDYWRAAPKGTKLDWPATWRQWIRTAVERGQQTRPGSATPRAWSTRPTQESALAAIEAANNHESDDNQEDGYIRIVDV